MKINGIYACGHEGEIELYGESNARDARAKWTFANHVCPDCYKDQQLAYAREMGACELTIGTEKQIAWAEIIRADFIKALKYEMNKSRKLAKTYPENIQTQTLQTIKKAETALSKLLQNPDSKFWIDNSDKIKFKPARFIFDFIQR